MIILSMEKSKSLQKLFTNTGGRNGLGKACCLKTGFSLQNTSVSGAEKYCYHRGVLLSGQICSPRGRLHRAPRQGAPKGARCVPKAPPGTAAGGQENGPLFHIVPRRREETSSAPGFWTGLFLWQPETVSFWARPKRNGFGKFADLRCFFYRPFF